MFRLCARRTAALAQRRAASVFSRSRSPFVFSPFKPRFFSTPTSTENKNENISVPRQARVVVVGGGIIGSSVAYHLAHAGWKDVVLLEKDQLTSGTTWHAAGLMVTYGSTSHTSTALRKYTKELYSTILEAETGQSTGFKPCGFIELATESKDRLEEFRRVAAFNRFAGVDVQEISPSEVKRLFPLCNTDDVLAGFYVKDDGRVNPVDACMALAKGARMQGAKLIEGVSVTGVKTMTLRNGMKKVTGVETTAGPIECDYVVNCAGMWARQFGELAGVSLPNQAAEHYYLITETMKDVDPSWPVIEDPASYTYIRPEGDGLMVGLFEPEAAAWNVNRIPDKFSFGEITPDWDRMLPFVEKAMNRVPATLNVGAKKLFCGPESFTPDLAPMVGEVPELKNYFVAAGMNSIGILTGGGIGRLVANWIVNGKPDLDVTGMNVDRFHRYQSNPRYRADRVTESLGLVYKCHYPYRPKLTARGAKRSPLYDRFAQLGAYFRDVSGWEGADFFAGPGQTPTTGTLTWGRPDWFHHWAREHRACREAAIIMDMSFMSKFLVQGRDAGAYLNRLATANVDGAVGMITYTQFLNEDGKMEADLTIMKQGEGRFMVVATDTAHRHVESWLQRHLPDEGHVFITDVTGAYAQLNVQGPLSRQVLQKVTEEDLSNEAFPFRTAREISIGYARVTCARITYLGELGYELHIPTEHALHVYEALLEAGTPLGLTHCGLKALASLRMEKAYRDYGHDMDNTDTLLEVGLGFTADMKKPGGFIGKEAVLKQQAEQKSAGGLPKRLCQILVKDPEPMMYHAEVVYRDGKPLGEIRAASYGHTLGGAVGLAMLETDQPITKTYLTTGRWEVEINGKMYPCVASLAPLYDPNNTKIKV
eukprot:TRINITY_DN6880_c0_g1_i1.p1 TRINITY_DN6880_c0_g1~~TRINITY_DN6880_c0_g1_i1.p1  ORF type:complete len:878 (-),score=245.93 TRINITY_DN6880_c0_g1_i1:263-2896(-)